MDEGSIRVVENGEGGRSWLGEALIPDFLGKVFLGFGSVTVTVDGFAEWAFLFLDASFRVALIRRGENDIKLASCDFCSNIHGLGSLGGNFCLAFSS